MPGPDLQVETTPIPGMLVIHLPVHGDARGWFKENWQREKMTALGLPDFGPVQNNVSFNAEVGATRGIHAEPWDKLVSIGTGRVFAAWVDLREGPSFGTTYHREIGVDTTVFIPRGVGNSYQALEPATTYNYLVNAHWRPDITYPSLNLADPTVAIPWPIPLDQAEVSAKDRNNPVLADVVPMSARKTLITGADGQLGRALQRVFPDAVAVNKLHLDVTDAEAVRAWPWVEYDTVINAAAYTSVDEAETAEGRVRAWQVNAHGAAHLAEVAREHGLTLVHFSTDYVFDGTREVHDEEEPLSPLGVYAQTKAAGDVAVATCPRHYVLRTSWVVGEGANFVRTMRSLAERGVSPTVVDDQVGRLTFTTELARAVEHLLTTRPAYGVYNLSNAGDPTSWAQVAAEIFRLTGRDPADVAPTSTAEYFGQRPQAAPRPLQSTLDLGKIEATGFEPRKAFEVLAEYVAAERSAPPDR